MIGSTFLSKQEQMAVGQVCICDSQHLSQQTLVYFLLLLWQETGPPGYGLTNVLWAHSGICEPTCYQGLCVFLHSFHQPEVSTLHS